MAVQWSQNSPSTAYNQYGTQFGQQTSHNHGQHYPEQYGQQMFQQTQSAYPQQPAQPYPQQTPPQQHPQQAVQQQYPHQTVQQQYFPQQQYNPQQQYGPQQYPSQQQFSSQLQYSPHQGGQYPNQYPPISNAAYASHIQHQPAQQGCYNCGSPAHWAQACPEPKRDTPAGAYSRPPPFKRQKPNPPVVTKYAVPSYVQQQHASTPQAFAPPYAQQSYAQYQGPHGPPTPQSGQSPHQQWPQQPYQHQQQPAPSQQQQHPQPYQQTGYQHQQHTYVLNAPPTPSTPHTSHLLNQASPQAGHSNASSYFTNGHYQQPLGPQAQQMSSASPTPTVPQVLSNQQQHVATADETIFTPSPEPLEDISEDKDDDLSKLDVPDIPVVTQGSFANLVDRPLPANFIVADALEPFEPPPPKNNGRCQSKYTVIDKLSTFTTCIKETKYWDDMKSDPIFSQRSDTSTLIPMERILAMYRIRREDEGLESADLEDGEWTRDNTSTTQHEGGRDFMDQLENSLARPCVTGSPEVYGNIPRDRKPLDDVQTNHRPDRPAQGTSAKQGPGGQYHWKRKSIRSVPPPPVREDSPIGSPERTPPMRSRTPSMYELNAIYQQEQGMKPSSSSVTGDLAHTPMPNGSGRDHMSYDMADPFEPPPPPGHLRKLSSYDGAADSPLPAGSLNEQINGNGVSGLHGSNGNGRSYSIGQSDSPNRRRSDAANGRKRDPEQVLSDEDNTPKRRQADDTKSKLKKRQPKVAAAYR
ncbi:MAG: hypothetical protein Q9213_003742 [Squamulea squamosa]